MEGSPPTPPAICNCLALRQAARRVTQFYDRVLAPSGVRATQFSILAVIGQAPEITMKDIAREMVLDRATLGHNLRPLIAQGFVALRVGADRRQRPLTLTRRGAARLRQTKRLWRAAQATFEHTFGSADAASLRGVLAEVASLDFEHPAHSPDKVEKRFR